MILEQFPEFGHAPELWEDFDAVGELAELLRKSTSAGDRSTGLKVIKVVMWAHAQSKRDEKWIHFCQDILRSAVTAPSLRASFASLLTERDFAQIAGYVEYLTSKSVLAEMAVEVRLRSRGYRSS